MFAILVFYPDLTALKVTGAIINIVAGVIVLLAPAAILLNSIRFEALNEYDDLLDDIAAVAKRDKWVVKARRVIGKLVWLIVAVLAVLIGVFLVLNEYAKEGGPSDSGMLPVILSVYIGFEGAVVILCYVLFRRFLGLLKPVVSPSRL